MTSIVPSWVKVILGLAVAGVIMKTLPILDLLFAFFYFCVIPMVFIGCLMLGVFGLYEWGWGAFESTWNKGLEGVKAKVTEAAVNLQHQRQQA
jgi:hypothetical protein